MFRSIRWTLQLWHAAILLVALLVLDTALVTAVSRAQSESINLELQRAARGLARKLEMPPPLRPEMGNPRPAPPPDTLPAPTSQNAAAQRSPDRPPFPPGADFLRPVPPDFLQRIGQNESDQPYFVVWAWDGSVARTSSPRAAVPPPALPAEWWGHDRDPTEFRQRAGYYEAIVPGPWGSRVLVGRSARREHEELLRLLWILAGAGAAVLAIGLGGGFLLSERATRPIRIISDVARSISASDLSLRFEVESMQSEMGSLAQTLNETFDRLEATFARQVQFTADASHELRTPLSVIHTHIELALSRPRTAEEYRRTLEVCMRAARRMRSLVDSLLVLSRSDAGKLDIQRETCSLTDIIQETMASAAPEAAERKVTLTSELRLVQLRADRMRLAQVIANLLNNAIRYNREGGSVCISASQIDAHAILSVADTGVGIQPEDQQRVFERFYRADKARTREAGGSGLGLAICQSIVEAHGGTITFTSEPGKGTTFVVRLPVCMKAAALLSEKTAEQEHVPV